MVLPALLVAVALGAAGALEDKKAALEIKAVERGVARADLDAQEAMAAAANATVKLTIVQVVLSGLGMIGLLVTIYYTRVSVGQTDQSLKMQHGMARRELRAYVNAKPVDMDGIAVGDRPHIRVELRNSGNTPASNVRLEAFFGWSKDPFGPHKYTATGPFFLGAGEDDSVRIKADFKLSADDIRLIGKDQTEDQTKHLLAIGKVTYLDVFDATHELSFGYVIGATGVARMIAGLNSAT